MRSNSSTKSGFFVELLKNLGFLIAFGIIIYILFPDMMRQVFQLYGALFGPVIIILLIVIAALPRKKRR